METYKEEKYNVVDKYDATCPSCSAAIKFDPASGTLSCPYCGYSEEIPQPELDTDKIAQELNFEEALQVGNFDWGDEKKIVICSACSAESVYDALEVANVCPYCGSNHVMESAAEDAIAPNGVIPFEITREQADINFKKWMKGKLFAPNEAKRSAKADSFSGVYLPYWTFDSKTASQYSAQYGINRTVEDRDGKKRIETDWYSTSGFYQEFIDDFLVRATTRHDEHLLRTIEPFNTNSSRSYNKEYLSGYIAERYSIGLEDGWKNAQKGIHNHLHSQIISQIRMKHNADQVRSLHFSTAHSDITYKYVMLPIWLSSFRYSGKTYQFLVNGQTGKVGGQSPISAIKVGIAIFLVLVLATLIFVYGEFG
jgi:predicted RNA-binding Zn-ribbon protein involved in translation (DUF1610 family)